MRDRDQTKPPPDLAALQDAAVTYLSRYAATEVGLARILARKVDRWARDARNDAAGNNAAVNDAAGNDAEQVAVQAADARRLIRQVVGRLTESGAISDTGFAASRVRSLARAGRSRRAIGARLAKSGVPGSVVQEAVPKDERTELAGALIHARKRRIGPWRKVPTDPQGTRRELATLARAGFDHGTAGRALKMPRDEAEALIHAFRAEL